MEVCSLDGRFITLVSTETQTDWEKVEQCFSCSCRVQKKTGNLQMWQEEVLKDAVVVHLEDAGEKEYDRIHLGLPRVMTCRREPKFMPRVLQLELPGIKFRKKKVLHKKTPSKTLCQYCQQRNQRYQRMSFIRSLKEEVRSDRDMYYEEAKEFEEILKEEKERLERKYTGTADELDTSMSINRQEWETEEEGWMKYVQRQRKRRYETPGFLALPKEAKSDIPSSPEKTPSTFELSRSPEELGDEPRTTGVLQKFYKDGNIFLIKYLDGSGTVFYPSGNPAIVITPAEDPDFIYIILEDKDKNRRMIGIFTPRGCATCYRPDGSLWLNITSGGGFCFDEAGDLRRRWNWLYFDPHVHDLPFKPLIFAMGPCICTHIHSQKHVYVSFFHKDNHVRFSVGSEIKVTCPESHGEPGQSILERDIQLQKTKIYCLLDQMQTCMSHPLANMQNIKPHYRFITRLEQLIKQVAQKKSLENTQPNEN